jgi:hypothetical protein
MILPQRRPFARSLVLFALLVSCPGLAHAGAFPYWGISFGSPERAAAHLGVSFGEDVPDAQTEGFAMGSGTILEAAVGMGAGTVGIGRSVVILTEEKSVRVLADLKAIVSRSWDEPRSASANSTYLGVEGGLSVAFVRFTMGVSKRLEDRSEGDDWLYHWGVGIQIRIGKAKKDAQRPPSVIQGPGFRRGSSRDPLPVQSFVDFTTR